MEKRFFLFILLASAAMFINAIVMNWLNPPPPAKPKPPQPVAEKKAEPPDEKPAGQVAEAPAVAAPDAPAAPAEPAEPAADPQADIPPQWVALGSVDPADPYRMLVILSNRGAAVERIELNSPQLRDLDEEAGYLGDLALEDAPGRGGAIVNVVGKGTPASKAGLQAGDLILAFNGVAIKDSFDVRAALRSMKPGEQVTLKVSRDEKETTLTATLSRVPLELVQPEDAHSLLFTLQQWGDREISRDLGLETREPEQGYGAQISQIEPDGPAADALLRVGDVITQVDQRDVESSADLEKIIGTTPVGTPLLLKVRREGQELQIGLRMPAEIEGFALRTGTWEVVSHDESQATFRRSMPAEGLEFIKRYRLAKADDQAAGRDYHLLVDVEIRNTGTEARKLAYQLDGPTGLPTEGWWYASKISRDWGSVGVRDVAVWFRGEDPELIAATDLIGDDEIRPMPEKNPLVYAGVDAQYVAAVLLPQHTASDELWFSEVIPLRVGAVPPDKNRLRLVNTSVRLVSKAHELQQGNASLRHEYVFFAGPKRPELLAKYELAELVYYGWFGWVAKPMLSILHFFYDLVGNYGLAIIMLTVLVRGCMFPLSRKQAISAQKMQELQPEIKKIAEKYKSNLEQRNKAQQELFKKHNYNPLGGCLLMFIQLPIFIGLYRSLMVDVELWQAPLISGLRWCSNLAAPDMLFRWKEYLPGFLADETGWLGPYFNILPIFTIALFLWQQKMFMPPPTDEQAAMQQKMIKYMMIFMGVMFFKVASGLCIYFIASSLWGIAERKLLPKTITAKPAATDQPAAPRVAPVAGTNGNGATSRARKKQRRGR
jgi:YidC/Oxa1 family membrane protein insertase